MPIAPPSSGENAALVTTPASAPVGGALVAAGDDNAGAAVDAVGATVNAAP